MHYRLGAVHILRQPLEGRRGYCKCLQFLTKGGGGVNRMLTIADEGGEGGHLKADDC